MKKAFVAYKTIWWENNKEWKLELKAKVFNQKQLQKQAIERWEDYLAYQKYLKILEERAQEFHHHNIRKTVIGQIVIGAFKSRQTKELQYQANKYMELSCVRAAVLEWRHKLLLIQTGREARDLYCVKYSLLKWKLKLDESISDKNKVQAIQSRLKTTRKKKILHSWQVQAQKEMILRWKAAQLDEMINSNLVKKNLKSWRKERHREQDRNYIFSIAINNNLEKRLVLREFLSTWVKKTNLRRSLNFLQELQNDALLESSLQIWRKKTRLCLKAQLFRKDKTLELTLEKWQNKLSEKEDVAILPALAIADKFYEAKLILKFWGGWQSFILGQKQIKAMEGTALGFRNLNLKGKFVTIWQERFSHKMQYNELLRKAYTYRTNVLLAKISYGIWNGSIRSKDLREKAEEADSFQNAQLTKFVIRTWQIRFQEKLAENERILAAEEFYESKLKRQAFSALFAFNQEKKLEEQRIIWARNVYKSKMASSIISSWFFEAQIARFQRKREGEMKKKLVDIWLGEVLKSRAKKAAAIEFKRRLDQKKLAESLSRWNAFKTVTKKKKQKERENSAFAKNIREGKLIRGSLASWRKKFQLARASKERVYEIFDENRDAIAKISIRHRFAHLLLELKERGRKRLRFSKMSDEAEEFRHQHLTKRILSVLKNSYEKAVNREKQLTIATNFEELRVLTFSLKSWRRKYQEKIEENQKTAVALQFWYEGLIWKTFKCWRFWKANRDAKKAFYDEAFARYRTSVERDWIFKLKDLNSKIEQASLRKARAVLPEREIILAKRVIKRWRAKCCPRLSELQAFLTPSRAEIPISKAVYEALPITEDVELEKRLFQMPKIPLFLQEELVSILTGDEAVREESPEIQAELENSSEPKLLGPNAFGDSDSSFPIYRLKPETSAPQFDGPLNEKENFHKQEKEETKNKLPDPSKLYLLQPQKQERKKDSPFPFSPMFSESSPDFPEEDDPLMDKEKRSWRFGQDRKPITSFLVLPERENGHESWGSEQSDAWSCRGSSTTSTSCNTTPAITLDLDVPLDPYVVPEFDEPTTGLPSRPTSPPKPKPTPPTPAPPKLTEEEKQEILAELLELTRLQEKLGEEDHYTKSVSMRMDYLQMKLKS
ncbi:Oidioi.mRNA.OKI2018_I69.chr2.g5530.t1.cds [Oikopleura dioica]|uniref:Oidioi.mRNA.OKI2018_I69.chr2.g5530.t1.cds n=1 Tax=Oikopleura dioica TaxID=34765 RepID=A0ABN7T146_OIKDI|nr:Oidioi.mRNA.OKI2018_I69.chr2.g5530.t1.cds [Oikopleura dioica]